MIPGVNDDDESIRQIAAFAASLPHLQGIDLLPYHTAAADKYPSDGQAVQVGRRLTLSEERMAEIAAIHESI